MVNISKNIYNFFDVADPPYDYEFLINMNPKLYPKYLKKIFKWNTGKNLDLKNPKTFNEKIQWLKLYDTTPLKTQLTDKVLVRDWIKKQIGEEYLKPVLWIGDHFDDIPFDELPNSFVIKCNHGSKWHYKIKDKEKFLEISVLKNTIKQRFDNWMSMTYFVWSGFELQYKDITPKIIIEPILTNEDNSLITEIEAFCFNGSCEFIQKINYIENGKFCLWNKNLEECDFTFNNVWSKISLPIDDNLKLAKTQSEKLSEQFKFVRVDWIICNNKLYFNEMTFTPFSGYFFFSDEKWNNLLGNMITIK